MITTQKIIENLHKIEKLSDEDKKIILIAVEKLVRLYYYYTTEAYKLYYSQNDEMRKGLMKSVSFSILDILTELMRQDNIRLSQKNSFKL